MTPARMAAIHADAMRTGRAWSEKEIAALIGSPGAVHVTLGHAFAIGRVTLDEAELLTIAVAPDAQGAGLGRACLSRFHDAVVAAGARSVFLEVGQTNRAARRLYTGLGYVEVGRRADYYGRGADALVLRLTFTP